MSKKMLINASHPEENRVAIVVDGILTELDIEIAGKEQSKGNIYKAVVVRVETGLQAAFVDYGAEKPGFLQIGEVNPTVYPPNEEVKGRPRIADLLQRGQEILVQIVKEERGNKGAALTTFLSLPGRYMVLMPDSTTKGVSRKISVDSERKKLKKTMAELELPERMGYIVRTAGIGKDKEELKRDFDYLVRLFEGITSQKDQIKAPAQLYQESNLAIRSIRDYFSTEMDEVLVDDHKVFQDTKDFFSLVMPELKQLVKRHRERRPIFSRYQIEEQIEGLSKNQASLPSGGSIVLDQTEALVAIDVNSGKMSGESGIEATAYKTNLEAAKEIGRQLRLRDLGGLVVIDFIDMRDRKNIREVELELRKALKDDKAKVSTGRISQFGLMEMSRQRLKPVLSVGGYIQCPNCSGLGQIKSVEAQAVAFLRQAHTTAAKGQIEHIEASVPIGVANYLLNQKRSTINELEQQLRLRISLLGRADMLPGELELVSHKREKQIDTEQQVTPVSHDNQIVNALAAAQQEEQEATELEENKPDQEIGENDKAEEVAEKPKRPRRRRRRKPAQAAPTSAEVISSDTDNKPADVQPAMVEQTTQPNIAEPEIKQEPATATKSKTEPTTEPGAEEKPKPRPRRRPRKKPSTTAATEETTATPVQNPKEEIPAEEKSKPTEKKPARKPKVTATHTIQDDTAAKEKPKRKPRRATTKKTEKPKESVSAETQTIEQTVSSITEVATEKPKRKPRTTTKKAVEAKATKQESATVATDEKPKRRTRTTTKKTTEKPIIEALVEKQAATEKPKPKPRKATKTAIKPDKLENKPAATEEVKPKRRPRKAPAKKKAEDTEQNPE